MISSILFSIFLVMFCFFPLAYFKVFGTLACGFFAYHAIRMCYYTFFSKAYYTVYDENWEENFIEVKHYVTGWEAFNVRFGDFIAFLICGLISLFLFLCLNIRSFT